MPYRHGHRMSAAEASQRSALPGPRARPADDDDDDDDDA
jgi:hypothetical protein